MLHMHSSLHQHQPVRHSVLRVKRVREKYESELKELERSERTAVEKQQDLRKQQMETEGELIRLQGLLRQKEQEIEDVTQVRSKSLVYKTQVISSFYKVQYEIHLDRIQSEFVRLVFSDQG